MNEAQFRRVEAQGGELTRYEFLVNEVKLGEIYSRREASWHSLPSGVRTGLRGRPTRWFVDGQPHRLSYPTRLRAAQELIRSLDE